MIAKSHQIGMNIKKAEMDQATKDSLSEISQELKELLKKTEQQEQRVKKVLLKQDEIIETQQYIEQRVRRLEAGVATKLQAPIDSLVKQVQQQLGKDNAIIQALRVVREPMNRLYLYRQANADEIKQHEKEQAAF